MSGKVKPIPDGYRTVAPYLFVSDGNAAIEYYKKAFGATERMRLPGPGGAVMHAELQMGDSVVMLSQEMPQMGHKGPKLLGGTPVMIAMYVENVDEVFKKAIAAGGKELSPVQNQFYGDRSGGLTDPFGHQWHLATHIEDVSPEEMIKRSQKMFGEKKGGG